jgi:glycerol-3-phosphate dehydrogenase
VSAPWSLKERGEALRRAERDGVDLLVVGGGITGAGVLRDAASRGLRALLVERKDFGAGTSSRSSKLIHGGLRYIAHGHLKITREACRERDLLVEQNPHLVRPLPLLFPAYRGSKVPLWQVRAVLTIYAALANFRRTSRFRMLDPREVAEFCPDLGCEGLRGAGLYWDAQVDDARLVLESLRSARSMGAEAVNHTEAIGFERDERGRIVAVRLQDRLEERALDVRTHAVVNASGPALERVRGLDRPVTQPTLRPAKGVHLVIPRHRVKIRSGVTFEGRDGRHLFVLPWDEVAIIGTTDDFSDEIDEPVCTIEEVHYLLSAANDAFPRAALTTNDLRSVFAGVRPLMADPDEDTPATSVSRELRIERDPSGLISAAGGKLTTYRSMGKAIVRRVLPLLPPERRAVTGPSRTAVCPLRRDDFDRAELEQRIGSRFGVASERAEYLVRTYGADAETLLAAAPEELWRPIGNSRFTFAEIPWSFRTECPSSLCDVLEHRLRLAIFAVGQGIAELDAIAATAAGAAGWDAERVRAETNAYIEAVRSRYQIQLAPNSVSNSQRDSAAA